LENIGQSKTSKGGGGVRQKRLAGGQTGAFTAQIMGQRGTRSIPAKVTIPWRKLLFMRFFFEILEAYMKYPVYKPSLDKFVKRSNLR